MTTNSKDHILTSYLGLRGVKLHIQQWNESASAVNSVMIYGKVHFFLNHEQHYLQSLGFPRGLPSKQ